MSEGYILASDLGGSGTKTMLFDLEGKPIAKSFQESKVYHPEPNVSIQDPEEMFMSSVEGIKECLTTSNISPDDVEALVFDGQQAGIMLIDDNYNAITHYDSWLDNRHGPYVDFMNDICGDKILEKTGTNNFINGSKLMWWKKERPEVFKKAAKVIIPATYVGGRLANLKAEDAYFEETTLGYTGLADLESSEWDKEICNNVDIPLNILSKIVKPTEIIGNLSKEYAELLGLPDGIPIVAGAGDFPAAGIGAGICQQGQSGDIAGTASIFFGCVEKWEPDATGLLRTVKSPVDGLWYQYALLSGGACVRWFIDTFLGKEKEQQNVFEMLDKKASEVPIGCDGLIFYPYIGGRLQPPGPNYNGAWLKIKWGSSVEHFYRSILESISYEYKNYYTGLLELLNLEEFKEIRAFGGGSASAIWNQIKSDVLGLPYVVLKEQECSLLGSALIASYAIGAIDDLPQASKKANTVVKRYEPDSKKYLLYDKQYQEYLKILEEHESVLPG